MARILIVDDEPHMRRILASNLRQDHHDIWEAGGVQDARRCFAENAYDVVFTDQKMPDGEGLEVLTAAHEAEPAHSVVFLTAVASFEPDVVRASARRAHERTRLLRENELLKDVVVRLEGTSDIFLDSPAIREVREKIARVAPTGATVLITGETGTGKELVARAIHRTSPRSAKPFVAVNCAAFTETLLESELFGHEKGAFTGADRTRQGLFEAAHEGTLFLDEAGEMSPAAQAKLLRILMDGQLLRVGFTRPRTVDVRVLVATHRNLSQHLRDGLFREDLFYRLAVVPIDIPPLRDRREDIPGLCEMFSRQVSMELKLPPRKISPAAFQALEAYHFPGNLRELKNLIERAYILSRQWEIGPEDFPMTLVSSCLAPSNGHGSLPDVLVRSVPHTFDLTALLEGTEKQLTLRTLTATSGAQAEAARRMGLSRSALAYKLNKYGIRASD